MVFYTTISYWGTNVFDLVRMQITFTESHEIVPLTIQSLSWVTWTINLADCKQMVCYTTISYWGTNVFDLVSMRMWTSKEQIHSVNYQMFPLGYLKEEFARQIIILYQYSIQRYKYIWPTSYAIELNRSDIAAVAIECLEKHLVWYLPWF